MIALPHPPKAKSYGVAPSTSHHLGKWGVFNVKSIIKEMAVEILINVLTAATTTERDPFQLPHLSEWFYRLCNIAVIMTQSTYYQESNFQISLLFHFYLQLDFISVCTVLYCTFFIKLLINQAA